MADRETAFRLKKVEDELGILRQRLHDNQNETLAAKFKLESDVADGMDRETRLRRVEQYVEQHPDDPGMVDWRLYRTEVLVWETGTALVGLGVLIAFYLKAHL